MEQNSADDSLPSDFSSFTKAIVNDALAPVRDDLTELNARIISYVPTHTRTADQILNHIFGAGGKRIRPALFFMAAKVLGYRGDHYYPIGAVTEFVHTASLLHDDVIDNATTRRGMPTANYRWGDQASVLVGDLIYSRASEMMAATGDMEVVNTFARAIRLMSDGELLQLENVYNADISESTYFRILECKTAVLISAACRSAGLLARSSVGTIDTLTQFGHNVGLAFQLIDDALDYTGMGDVVGKDTMSDLIEGKVTLPVILVMQEGAPEDRQLIIDTLASTEISREQVAKVAELVEKYETAEKTVERAQRYTRLAMEALYKLPASAERDDLENLASKLLYRVN